MDLEPIKVDEYVISLDLKDTDIFFKVLGNETIGGANHWVLKGMKNNKISVYPVLFFDKKYVKVSEETITILFGGKNDERNEQSGKESTKGS